MHFRHIVDSLPRRSLKSAEIYIALSFHLTTVEILLPDLLLRSRHEVFELKRLLSQNHVNLILYLIKGKNPQLDERGIG